MCMAHPRVNYRNNDSVGFAAQLFKNEGRSSSMLGGQAEAETRVMMEFWAQTLKSSAPESGPDSSFHEVTN